MSLRKPIYVDMDNVLIAPILDRDGNAIDLLVRPGVKNFLERLSMYGELTLLTAASHSWAQQVLEKLGATAKLFKDVKTGEDLFPIWQQVEVVRNARGLSDADRESLYNEIKPILPPGVIFDDYPAGSEMYRLKGHATGIVQVNPHLWIPVDVFSTDDPDRGGLEKAFQEFKKRNSAWRARPAIGKMLEGSVR
jgi:hypothetical protein